MKSILLAIIIAVGLIGGTVYLVTADQNEIQSNSGSNVTIENGQQIVKISAKGGYQPKVTTVKADLPTTLQIETAGTYDCSTAVVIPDLDYKSNLPPSGVTEINIPPKQPGEVLNGGCSMGMYHFQIRFE